MFKQTRRRVRSTYMAGAVAASLVVGAAVLAVQLFGNPFRTESVDRSMPPVLVQLRDLSDFHAAQGQFEVTVDHEDDVMLLPAFIAGERVQYAALGSVDATVDFGMLGADAVTVSDDRHSVSVTLPEPALAAPVLDLEQSHVMNRDRGLFNRVGGLFSDNPTSEAALEKAATEKIAAAAAASNVRDRARENTRAMLTTLLSSLGFDHVEVTFAA
jgi:hypothetical protein